MPHLDHHLPLRLLWRSALTAGCIACAPLPPATTASPPGLQAEIQPLLYERRFATAAELLTAHLSREPGDIEAGLLLAECRYRMADYEGSRRLAVELRQRASADIRPRERDWFARLAARPTDSQVRTEVEADIAALAAERPEDPGVLLAISRGYQALGQQQKQQQYQWLALERTPPNERQGLEAPLLEALIAARDPETRRQLAASYLGAFPNGRGADLAATARLQDQSEAGLVAILEGNPHSRALLLQAAAKRIKEDGDTKAASALLQSYAALTPGLNAQAAGYLTEVGWLFAFGMEQGLWRELRGWVALLEGRPAEAWREWQSSLESSPIPHAWVYEMLGKLATAFDREREAIANLLAALDVGGPSAGIEAQLAALVKPAPGQSVQSVLAERTGTPRFADISVEAGLAGVKGERLAWGDFDGDGRPDLLIGGTRLFRNQDGRRLVEITQALGLPQEQEARGGIWADWDNDGDLDLLQLGRDANRLLRNEGGRQFRDVTLESRPGGDPGWLGTHTEAAAWGDLDGDGWLDLYTANYEQPGPERGLCGPDRLLHNLGKGTLRDEAQTRGVVTDEPMCGRGVVWTDLDGDGDLDILVTNYRLDPNQFWLNDGTGRFEDAAERFGLRGQNKLGLYGHTIAAAVGDLNGDQRLDVLLANLAHPRYIDFSDFSQLLMATGDPAQPLHNRFSLSGLGFDETNAEPVFFDADNDGDLDLYLTSIYPGRGSHFYLNEGDGRFHEATWLSGTRLENTWGTAIADVDGDGRLDLAVGSADGVRLLRNLGPGGHWLRVRVQSRECQPQGIGARVRLSQDGRVQIREIQAGRGSGDQDEAVAHFGLGTHTGPVEVAIRTSCRQERRYRIQRLDREIRLVIP